MKRTGNFNFLSHYTYYLPTVGGMFGLLGWLLVGSLLGGIVTVIFPLFMNHADAMQYGMLVSYPVQFIPAMMYAASKSRNNCINMEGALLDNKHFGKCGGFLCALMVTAATLAAAFCADALTAVLPQMPESLQQVFEAITQGSLWANLLCVAVFAPIFEEWLCRGMVLRGLLYKMKPVWAIIVSALFFALIHGNPWQAIPAFLIGCLLGYVYYKTGSLKLTMLMHCVNNASAVLLSHTDKFKDVESWADVLPGKQYWIIFAACLLLLALVIKTFAQIPIEGKRCNCDTVPSLFENIN